MANSMRDPFFWSAWMISNELINAYINDIPVDPRDPGSDVYQSWKVRVLRMSAHENYILSESRGATRIKTNHERRAGRRQSR